MMDRDPNKPNKAMRLRMKEEWNKLNEEEKLYLRSQRARRGLQCDVCGNPGYFREICPKECFLRYSTPRDSDSDDDDWLAKLSIKRVSPEKKIEEKKVETSTNLLWTNFDPNHISNNTFESESIDDLSRALLHPEKSRLQSSDAKMNSFEFYCRSQVGYNRNLPELTLHQILRRMMRILKSKLDSNAGELESKFDTRLLQPPIDSQSKTFYPPQMGSIREYKDYFFKKALDTEAQRIVRAHRFRGGSRSLDQLDVLFRGNKSEKQNLSYYKDNPHAAKESIHSKIGWKSVLSNSDQLAISDLAMAEKQAQVQALLERQGEWMHQQKKNMTEVNDRFEHGLFAIHQEILKEQEREMRFLQCGDNKKQQKRVGMILWKERMDSVDLLIKTMTLYQWMGGIEEMDYLLFCLEEYQSLYHDHHSKSSKNRINRGKSNGMSQQSLTKTEINENTTGMDEMQTIGPDQEMDEQDDEETSLQSPKSKKVKGTSKTADLLLASAENPYYASVQDKLKVDRQRQKKLSTILHPPVADANGGMDSKADSSLSLEETLLLAKKQAEKIAKEKEEQANRSKKAHVDIHMKIVHKKSQKEIDKETMRAERQKFM